LLQTFGMNQAVCISYLWRACSFPVQDVVAFQYNSRYTQNYKVQGYGARVEFKQTVYFIGTGICYYKT